MGIIYRRPIVSFCTSMIVGILVAVLSDSVLVAGSLFVLLATCFFVFIKKHKRGNFVLVGILVFFLLGSLEFLAIDHLQLGVFSDYEGSDVSLRGYVASEPDVNGDKISYIIKVTGIRQGYGEEFAGIKGKILLTTLLRKESGLLDYGRELIFGGILSHPKGVRNPGGFDYRRVLAQKGVGASVFAYPYAIEAGKDARGNLLVLAGLQIRNRIVVVIENSLPRQQAGLLNGMLIGYREGLSDEVQEAFSNAGLTHIMAVSGANIAFLILPLSILLKLFRIRKRAANLMIIGFLVLFVFITGFEPSVLRAVLMASVLLLSSVLYREPDTYSALAVSCLILLAASPCMLFNVGFQLSYGATLGIIMLYKNIREMIRHRFIPGMVAEVFAAAMAAQLGVLPVIMLHFNKVSLISILPNMLVAPMLELITILGTLMAILGQFSIFLSRIIGHMNNIPLSTVLYITKWSAGVPFATVKTITPPIVLVAAYYIVIWFLLWYKPMKGIKLKSRHTAIVLSFAAVIFLSGSLQPGRLDIVFLDVGQGDSAFIRTYTGKTILIDGGGSSNSKTISKTGEKVVIPFLLDSGVSSLDAVIATHPHSDHIQGLQDVLKLMKVKRLILPSLADESGFSDLIQMAQSRDIPISRCSSGDILRIDDKTTLKVLSPEPNCPVEQETFNNTSLVLKLCYDQTSVLFTGDAEAEVENKLLAEAEQLGAGLLEADVLKVAHHGSNTSTSKAYLELVDPEAAIIGVGRNNFGHPSLQVLDLLDRYGVACFRTDECGAVILRSNGKTIKIKGMVKQKVR